MVIIYINIYCANLCPKRLFWCENPPHFFGLFSSLFRLSIINYILAINLVYFVHFVYLVCLVLLVLSPTKCVLSPELVDGRVFSAACSQRKRAFNEVWQSAIFNVINVQRLKRPFFIIVIFLFIVVINAIADCISL